MLGLQWGDTHSFCCSSSSGCYDAGEDNRGRSTDNLAGCHPIGTVGAPTSIIPPILCRMPFLPQLSQFILAWDGHQIMLACIPAGLVTLWFGSTTHPEQIEVMV